MSRARVLAIGDTHVGMKRTHNEDSFMLTEEDNLFVVADGMGGHASGEVASGMAIDTLRDFFRATSADPEATWPYKMDKGRGYEENRLITGIKLANLRIYEAAQKDPQMHSMGTTVVGILVVEDGVLIAHVGDSRVYHVRDNKIVDRTRDHTHVELLLQEGLILETEIPTHPMRSFVEHCLGGDRPQPPVTTSGPHKLLKNDMLLLCSDGFWGGLTDASMGEVLAAIDASSGIQDMVEKLVHDAVARNKPGSDNTTVAAIIWRGTD